ncbi:MAG: aryldialkylphosphatase [Betaproteobacteria bacterium]|jgi:phosphotriesterase-related protein|nr:aryldialkylphosphatase [Betaproteobacteria bacterium]
MTRLHRDVMRGKAQTVLGLIDPATLGATLMHEHLLWDIRTPTMRAEPDQGPEISLCNCYAINYGRNKAYGNYRLSDESIAVEELQLMAAAGGRSVVELSSGGLDPRPNGLVTLSRNTGVHLIMGCGHYVDEYQPHANHARTVEQFAAEMIDQVQVGAWNTDVRAGIIGEIGCQAPWTDLEKRVMLGAVLAMNETGAALNVHPGRHPDQPQEVADFVRTHGADPSRVIISHIDRTIFDEDRLLRLADSGVVIEFDLFGMEQSYYPLAKIDMPNDAIRLRMMRKLIERGHIDRIAISHDICYRTRLTRFGGHGYAHIFSNVIPQMLDKGFSAQEIDTLMVSNPRRLLTFV